jgi:hypothetical protein
MIGDVKGLGSSFVCLVSLHTMAVGHLELSPPMVTNFFLAKNVTTVLMEYIHLKAHDSSGKCYYQTGAYANNVLLLMILLGNDIHT